MITDPVTGPLSVLCQVSLPDGAPTAAPHPAVSHPLVNRGCSTKGTQTSHALASFSCDWQLGDSIKSRLNPECCHSDRETRRPSFARRSDPHPRVRSGCFPTLGLKTRARV